MKFLLMIFSNEAAWKTLSENARKEIHVAHLKFREQHSRAGKVVGGNALQPESTGARVTLNGGERRVTDGPFADTKEVIGGYYLADVASKQEAMELAKQIPLLDREYVEVRPVLDVG